LLSSTLSLPGEEAPLCDAETIEDRIGGLLDLIIDCGPCRAQATTVINLANGMPELVRAGRGSLAPFGLE
jgi:tRNA A37 threonylcarbamoyladenosine synthetase subunit TsaC/SUA5/YrdC